MKVTTSCSGRFHIFDQARQLHRLGVLHRFINDYPKWMTRRWEIPDDKVTSLVANGMLARATRWFPDSFGHDLKSRTVEKVHDLFSRRLAKHVPTDSDVFIGLSSFCLQAIERAKALGQFAVVDHGSLHQRTERRLLLEEGRLHGFATEANCAPEWIIDKEDREFRAADMVIVLSEAARNSFVEEGVEASKIFVNPCGVNLTQFAPVETADDGVFRVIYCGNSSLRKGVHYLLQAFSELQLDRAELWLIGARPPLSFGKYLAKYYSDQVRFLGPLPQADLPQVYSRGSVFVLPSLADGFGMVVPQAMACGLSVIVTRNVGAADIVTDGVDGFVVPARDVSMLKQRLLELYQDRHRTARMGEAARSRACAQLGWEGYGERLVLALARATGLH